MTSMISFILLLSLSISVRATETSIPASLVKACAKTPEPEVCVDELQTYPEIGTAPVTTMAYYSIGAASVSAQWALDAVSANQNKSSIAEYSKCLEDCSGAMQDAIKQLEKARDLWDGKKGKKNADFDKCISQVMTDASTCDESCKGNDQQSKIEKLPDWTEKLTKLCKITLAFAQY
ncbi:hypothetical protein LUZ60_012086 [Juncus effusus]|nr:hypothetical protein LUZ60_012086 [Juncus effusus]